jgi:hypothetical protein
MHVRTQMKAVFWYSLLEALVSLIMRNRGSACVAQRKTRSFGVVDTIILGRFL